MLYIITFLSCNAIGIAGGVESRFIGGAGILKDTSEKNCRCIKYQRRAEREYRRQLQRKEQTSESAPKLTRGRLSGYRWLNASKFTQGHHTRKANSKNKVKRKRLWFKKDIAACS